MRHPPRPHRELTLSYSNKSNPPAMTPLLSPDLKQIAKLLDRSRPQVVVVVGTGVAINATDQPHASWLGLLKHGIRHLVQKQFQPQWGVELEASLDAAFSTFHLQSALQHAELVEQALNTPNEKAFAQWLESAFANFKTRDDEKAKAPLNALRDLHEAGALLLTTNYDTLLSDITGAPPVTWEEHADFHRVTTRQKPGILHIHGHWQRPSSIVLGRSSYDRVVADVDLQQLFRTLWLDWSWIYVGCGDGLDDPNLGRLLEWSKGWGVSALPDFFLARDDKAKEIAARPSKPPNLVSIGYLSHDELSVVLRSVTPAARCWPFVRVDDEFPLFHVPGASDPFPTRQEYLDGVVPTFAADSELLTRLQTHGWACCIDVASVGKTTLALRAATTHEQRAHPVFYLDLKRELEDDADASPVAAVNRLARPGSLLILDNIHYQSELARRLWQQWNAKPSDSRGRLLLVATRIHQPVVVTPEQDLMFFERHPANPAILLHPTPEDLGRLAKHLYCRVSGAKCPPMPEPPAEALAVWHALYRAALNAFTFAVLDSLADFQNGKWPLPPSRASAWVRKHWLDKLDAPELDNAICLAAFGAQELEMRVQDDALPHPAKQQKLFELGLVAETRRGQLKQYRLFELREPGWGRLILGAVSPAVDEEDILFATASRHLQTAIVLSARLRRDRDHVRFKCLWERLAENGVGLVEQAPELPLSSFLQLIRLAIAGAQPTIADLFWRALEDNLDELAARAWETPLEHLAYFLDEVKEHPVITRAIWKAFEEEPQKLAARVLETQLHAVARFLKKAENHKVVTEGIWEAYENNLQKLAELTWDTPLSWIHTFLSQAREHPVITNTIQHALATEPQKLAAFAWETPLNWVADFLERTQEHAIITKPIWDAFEQEPQKLATRALGTQLHSIAVFLGKAHEHPIVTNTIWEALENEPQKTATLVWATELADIATFLQKARGHPLVVNTIWESLQDQPVNLAVLAWDTPLGQLAAFLKKAEERPLVVKTILEALRQDPKRLGSKGMEATLNDLVGFGHHAPIELLEIAVRGIAPGHWDAEPADEGLAGATWLVWHFSKIDRSDLADDLATLLLRRANWRDFPSQGGGFAQICWLLANVPASASELVEPFLNAVRTGKSLQIAYAATSCGQLASGLRQLALHQSAERCRQFHHKGLGGRLNKELARFETAAPNEQSAIMQFLGCAGLCGWAISHRGLASITFASVSQLPLGILPHRPEATKVEDYQLQLWLGLRAFVSIARGRLLLPRETIEETLKLWRANLGETASTPATAAHRVNQSMVAWLETCSRANPPALLPSTEPLWTLAGFPARLVLPN